MKRKDEAINFAHEYAKRQNGDGYEAYAEQEDIAKACINAIQWADNTMLERVEKWIKLNLEKFVYTSAHSGKGKINPYYVIEALRKEIQN
jgi:hypothetical protein